jgi:RsiW-degrading membrane proteinase PrsW (M82 family)
MQWLILLALAIAPGIAISIYVYEKDRFEREPRRLLVISFLLGMAAIFPALFLELILEPLITHENPILYHALIAFAMVAPVEEIVKFLCLRYYAYRSPNFNEPLDGIIYSVMVAMGFATLENIFYVMQYGMQNALLRMFTAVPAHATFGIAMGYFAGIAKFSRNSFFNLVMGILLAVLLHGAYNFFQFISFIEGMATGALVSLVLGIIFARNAIRKHQHSSPFGRMRI